MKRLIIAAIAIAAMAGCTKDEGFDSEKSSDNIVNFSSQSIGTRTNDAGTEWEAADKIGIYSVGFASDYANVAYQADDNGTKTEFSVVDADTQILYPNAESGSVDFYAYYPYDANVGVSDIATIDISEQSDLGAIDFMTASESVDYGSQVVFDFYHKLAMVILNISPKETITSLEALTARLEGIETCGDYYTYGSSQGELSGSLTSVSDVDLTVSVAEDKKSATITSILHPGEYSSANLVFEINGTEYAVAFATELAPSYSHTFALALGNDITGFESGSTISKWGEGAGSDLTPDSVDIIYNSADDLYEIYTAAGLKAFADLVNGSENTANAITYGDDFASFSSTENLSIDGKLMNNINISSVCYEVDGTTTGDVSWTPIGNYSASDTSLWYAGTFDGDGFEISGLYINSSSDLQGLFGFVNGATITDLGVSCSVTGGIDQVGITGVVVGYASSSSISGCYSNGTVIGSKYVGGVVGYASSSSISDCYNMSYVESDSVVGGVVGSAQSSSSISDCYNTGFIEGVSIVGGVVGSAISSSSVSGCYNEGAVEGSSSVGGIAGIANVSTVSSCYSSGNIDGNSYVGGITGQANENATVISCYSVGTVSGSSYVGGVVGWVNYSTITSCYSVVEVSGSSYVGGVVGDNYRNESTISYCYYDTDEEPTVGGAIGSESSGASDDDTNNVKGLATSEMQAEDVVLMLNNGAYLYNQTATTTVGAWVYNEGEYPAYDPEGTPTLTIDYWTLSEFDADTYPSTDTWYIPDYDATASSKSDFLGLRSALTNANGSGNITVIFLNLEAVPDDAFDRFDYLTSIELPNATSIGDYAFEATPLTSISVPNATSIGGYAFVECPNLETVSLPKAETIGNAAFSSCSSITTLDLGSTGTGVTLIGSSAFYNISTSCALTIKIADSANDDITVSSTTLTWTATFNNTATFASIDVK